MLNDNLNYISLLEPFSILEDIPVPVILTETDKTIRYANKQALQLGNYKWLTGKKCNDPFYINKDYLCNNVQPVKEEQFFKNDGTKIPVEVSSSTVYINGKKLILWIACDISAHENIENQLQKAKQLTEHNEAELLTIFNKVDSTIIIFDKNKRLLRVNQKGNRQFNIDENNSRIKFIGEILNCEFAYNGALACGFYEECSQCKLLNFINSTVKDDIEYNKEEVSVKLVKDDKTRMHTFLLSTAVIGSNGTTRYIATLNDITDRKEMETELVAAKEKAEVSEKLKTAFLNNISHEIRTPLNGLLGFLDFFEDESNTISKEERRLFVDIMRKSGHRLINTVEDIVETSKLDSGITELKKEPVKLKKITDQLEENINKQYADSDVEFYCVLDPELQNFEIETDESKLLRILRSLLENAFKFTKKGKVAFVISDTKNQIIFSVCDTGIGIDNKNLNVIFEPFRQIDINMNRAFDGNGLGLTIAKKMINLLGGEIQVQSEKGKGSCFSFALPKFQVVVEQNTLKNKVTELSDDSFLDGKKILIAEDDEFNYLFLEAVLKKEGCILIHAKNGKEAVNLYQQEQDISLVIMDLKMPVMNGIDATFKIKAINSSVPVIAHSAYVLNNEKEQSLAAGCADYIAKPVKKADLLMVLKKHIVKQ